MRKVAVLTMGTFDLLHSGHLDFLEQCASLGRLVVAVNGSEYVNFFKNHHPIIPTACRMRMLAALKCVDTVVPNLGDCEKIIKHFVQRCRERGERPVIAIGTSWAPDKYLTQIGITRAMLVEHDIMLVYVHERHPEHSTHIIDRAQRKLP